ncbi:MAG TPA: TonB-dependent siderophore receptor [Steroidobacteraceae bacterium]|nr:TonB-dependent siderophore receptor [Steroidobacteraceae bacterium]
MTGEVSTCVRAPSGSIAVFGRVAGALGLYLPWALSPGAEHAAVASSAALPPLPSPEDPGSGDDSPLISVGDLSQVTVNGVRTLLHEKLAEREQNAPQSITVVTDQLMAAQGTTNLEDALRNVPGITLNAGEGAARGDTVNLRGFSAFNDFFLDGIRDSAVYTRDDFDLQSVEVLKGPGAVLFGRGSTGGAINQVSKAPLLIPFENVTAELGSNDLYRAAADLDTPIGSTAAVRLNLMGQSSAVAERDDVRSRRWGVAPAVAFGIGERDSLVLAYLHQQEDNIPDTGIPFVDGRPASVPRSAFFGLASDTATTDVDIFTARYRHDFSDSVSLDDTLRYGRYQFDYQFESPNFGDDPPTATTPLTAVLVGRDAPDSAGVATNLDDQLDLTAHFQTGFIAHTLVAGVEIARQTAEIDRYRNPFDSDANWVRETALLDPDPNEIRPAEPVTSKQDTVAPSGGAYVIDTLAIGQYVSLTGGFRYDDFSASYKSLTLQSGTLLRLHELNRLGSPRASLIIKPTPRQSYYLSFGTSFDPSAEALTLTTTTAALGPVKARSFEVGAKSEWLNGGLMLTQAVFRTQVDNAQTNDPDNPTITVLNGNERVDGVELQAIGHLTRRWEIASGYTYLDGRTLASGTFADVGKVMPNTAHNQLNLWTEYDLPAGWEVGAGGNWLSHRFADGAETAYVPGYVVWNAMVSYDASPRLRLQLNAYDLFNKLYYDGFYYTGPAENHIIPGAGRSVALTLHWKL